MATALQYEIFKSAYDEEGERFGELESRANVLLGACTFYIGAIAFGFDDVVKFAQTSNLPEWLYITLGLPLVAALVCTLVALVVRDYERPFDPEEVIKKELGSRVSEEEFLDSRIADLAVATNRNSKVSDGIATWLIVSASFLVVAALAHLGVFVWALMTVR